MYQYIDEILTQDTSMIEGNVIGHSREGRPINGYVFGKGERRISLIGGCHADEPVGPLLLRKLVHFLYSLDEKHELLTDYYWSIVPHCNPDGEAINRKWYTDDDRSYDLAQYIQYVRREAPKDDVEFGFPIAGEFDALRPENQAVYDFWIGQNIKFDLHASLHGMARSYGPWFLLDRNWMNRTDGLQKECVSRCHELGYLILHDVDRKGEKGFTRIAYGFCTRPDAGAMRQHFLELGDTAEAQLFRPSSMESVRSFSGDTLTMVSEMPLFIVPQTNTSLEWPNSELISWKEKFAQWKLDLSSGKFTNDEIITQADALGVKAMPVTDQMKLQWQMIVSGINRIK